MAPVVQPAPATSRVVLRLPGDVTVQTCAPGVVEVDAALLQRAVRATATRRRRRRRGPRAAGVCADGAATSVSTTAASASEASSSEHLRHHNHVGQRAATRVPHEREGLVPHVPALSRRASSAVQLESLHTAGNSVPMMDGEVVHVPIGALSATTGDPCERTSPMGTNVEVTHAACGDGVNSAMQASQPSVSHTIAAGLAHDSSVDVSDVPARDDASTTTMERDQIKAIASASDSDALISAVASARAAGVADADISAAIDVWRSQFWLRWG